MDIVKSSHLLLKDEAVESTVLDSKFVGLLFSKTRHEEILPELRDAYTEIKAKGGQFEIVYCTWDYTVKEHDAHRKKMPWLTIPYENRSRTIKQLNDKFKITSTPALIILSPTGELVTRCGLTAIYQHGAEAYPNFEVHDADQRQPPYKDQGKAEESSPASAAAAAAAAPVFVYPSADADRGPPPMRDYTRVFSVVVFAFLALLMLYRVANHFGLFALIPQSAPAGAKDAHPNAQAELKPPQPPDF